MLARSNRVFSFVTTYTLEHTTRQVHIATPTGNIDQKPPKRGDLFTQDTLDNTNDVCIREVSLYIRVKTSDIACVT